LLELDEEGVFSIIVLHRDDWENLYLPCSGEVWAPANTQEVYYSCRNHIFHHINLRKFLLDTMHSIFPNRSYQNQDGSYNAHPQRSHLDAAIQLYNLLFHRQFPHYSTIFQFLHAIHYSQCNLVSLLRRFASTRSFCPLLLCGHRFSQVSNCLR
jgi:hypothetical protein